MLTDCDGVLTDGGVYYSERGEELKRFSIRDGMGVERLRDAGIATAIITRETLGERARGAPRSCGMPHVYLGVQRQGARTSPRSSRETRRRAPSEVAYIGDDVNDLGDHRARSRATG